MFQENNYTMLSPLFRYNITRYSLSWNNRNRASIIFYDNEVNNINDVDSVWNSDPKKPMIACNHIDDNLLNTLLLDKEQRGINYTFLRIFDHNTYTIELRSANFQEKTIPCQGFSDSHKNDLIKWIQQKQGKSFIVLFDWDQTISVTNGIIVPSETTIEMYQECAEYLLGGAVRLRMFQELEKFILDNNGEIFILTSNTLAYEYIQLSDSKRHLFLKIVQQVFSSIDDQHILSTHQDGMVCSKAMRLLSNKLFFNSCKTIMNGE